jgi:transcription-repair coupling factor (superfamily II helicase)
MKERMEDRFGPAPKEFDNLINVVKIRNMGGKLGFEKIIVKNGMMILFFVGNPMSAYYNSPVFERVLTKVNSNPLSFNLKQNENKLKIVTRGVDTLGKALDVLQKIS